ncbi:hypothetical protein GQX74_007506 [Glossina fuscipes]|nr:hypothetical protein GQX74_007506 [Glossina fuscipes]
MKCTNMFITTLEIIGENKKGVGFIFRRLLRTLQELSPQAVVAEWLRRLTRNQIPSGSVGSNPTGCAVCPTTADAESEFIALSQQESFSNSLRPMLAVLTTTTVIILVGIYEIDNKTKAQMCLSIYTFSNCNSNGISLNKLFSASTKLHH